ncbi:10295_t:CDS:2 [Acaulospora morrowiae]|uniref:10295_t:CDS:1 n=1 Tax=Acaulospora morrowiae TaxID=94023 RepID=A0A9N9BVU6_9GLOM|nr:10295_t:CDS:2 [Acaulospora morrowiae]
MSDEKKMDEIEPSEKLETINLDEKSVPIEEISESKVMEEKTKQETIKISKLDLGLLFIGLIFACFLATLEGTIVSTALPRIASDLKAIDKYSWVATAYLLTYNAFQPIYGKTSDIFGRRATMIFSFMIFLIGSAGSGSATSIDMLIAFRVIQGAGGGGIMSLVFITISDIFPLEERPKYQAIIWATFGVSAIVGPILGGGFVDHLTWRWAFYINLPFGALAILFVLAFLKLPFAYTSFKDKLLRIDWLGSVFIILVVFAILLPTSWGGNDYPWKSAPVISLYCATAVLIGIFAWIEHRWAVEPIIPGRILKNLTVAAVFTTNFLSGAVLFSLIYYIPVFFQVVRGEKATSSGLQLLPLAFGLVIFSMVSGAIVRKTPGGYKVYITIGCALVVVGMSLLSTLSEETSRIKEIFYLLIPGIGFGFELQMCLIAVQSAVAQNDMAIVTSLAGFFQSIGGSIGIAIASSVLNSYLSAHILDIPPNFLTPDVIEVLKSSISGISSLPEPVKSLAIHIYVKALHRVFHAGIAFSGIAFISCLFIKRYKMVSMEESAAVAA